MEIVLIITLIAAVLILLPQSASSSPQPQYVIIQATAPAEQSANGPGCLVWVIGGLVLLTLLGVIRW
ncbi:MAG: hypothetical protein SH847_10355 [Roseiflexaceae bacterium]|nr:hypothetical protein [Roseiflexaceae bacterium]